MRNKKGTITTPVVDFWAIIAFILVILLFYFIIRAAVESGSKTMPIRASEVGASAVLESYLRTPVTVDGNEMQMSELIIESYSAGNYDNLKIHTKNLLSHASEWVIGMTFPLESVDKCVEYSSTDTSNSPGTCAIQIGSGHTSTLSSFLLPTPDRKTIRIWIAKKL